jgi:hypothetical protein
LRVINLWPTLGLKQKRKVAMTKRVYFVLASFVLVTTLAINVNAQSRSRQELRVDVPFAFNVGNTSLPAGEYRISIVNPASDCSVIQIAGVEDPTRIMVLTKDIASRRTGNARIAFRRYGSQYFLAQVWMAAEPVGLATPHSRTEKQLQRQLGNVSKNYDTVVVNAF